MLYDFPLGIVNNPITHNLYNNKSNPKVVPIPPSGLIILTEDNLPLLTEDDQPLLTES